MYAKNSLAALMTILSDCEVMLTRIFEAPRELVFKAHTEPDLIPQWWGLWSNTTLVEKIGVLSSSMPRAMSLLLTVSIARLCPHSVLSTHLNLKASRAISSWIRRSSKNFPMGGPD